MKDLIKQPVMNAILGIELPIAAKPFRPTDNMILFLFAALVSESKMNIKSIAETVGITRQCWYYWMKNPLFVQWFKERLINAYSNSSHFLALLPDEEMNTV